MASDISNSLVSRHFSNQYVWLRYKQNKDLRWDIYNTEVFRKEAVELEKTFFCLMNNDTLKWRKRKKLWKKGKKWRYFHRIYGLEDERSFKYFKRLIRYIEKNEGFAEENHDYSEEDCDYSFDEASGRDDEHHEDGDDEMEDDGSQHTESVADHDGYQSHGEEYEDLMARVDLLREKMKMSMVVYVDSPQQEWERSYSYPDISHDCENDELKGAYGSENDDEMQVPDEGTNAHRHEDIVCGPFAQTDIKINDFTVDLKENIDGSKYPSISQAGEEETSIWIIRPEHFETKVETMKSKNKNKDKKDESLKKNNESLDYGPTLEGGGILAMTPPLGCVNSVKNTSMILNLEEDKLPRNNLVKEKLKMSDKMTAVNGPSNEHFLMVLKNLIEDNEKVNFISDKRVGEENPMLKTKSTDQRNVNRDLYNRYTGVVELVPRVHPHEGVWHRVGVRTWDPGGSLC